jgi:predicted metal-dependent hydrolase
MFEVDGITVVHRINPRMKHAYLQVEPDGTVLLKSNGKNRDGLKRFVASKRAWIEKQRHRCKVFPAMRLGRDLLYLGQIVPLEQLHGHAFRTENAAALKKSYDRFYRARAEATLTEKTQRFAEMMGVSFHAIRLRKMKRRWGSCSKDGIITYNTLLMQLPEAMIDYTVVHELAHRVHFNHSADFHALVSAYLPNEKALRRDMRYLKAVPY